MGGIRRADLILSPVLRPVCRLPEETSGVLRQRSAGIDVDEQEAEELGRGALFGHKKIAVL